jgi:predicted peptidase
MIVFFLINCKANNNEDEVIEEMEEEMEDIMEDFNDVDRPFFNSVGDGDYYLLEPWNYGKQYNSEREYPLVVFLHGSGGAGNISYLNYIGYDNPDDASVDSTAYMFQQNHPCFSLVPQTTSSWNNNDLIDLVEKIKSDYRIENSRIYLIGYSMGGSGSYSFINAYYDYNKQLFAGLIRLAGQSQTEVRNAIAENTNIWLHIGLSDTQLRINITQEAYDFLSDYYPNAIETVSDVPIDGYTGKTYSLKIDDVERFKRTEYEGVGHGVAAFPFKDPNLIEWLFSFSLK